MESSPVEKQKCQHPYPELCAFLGKHIAGGLLDRWNDSPKYRKAWCDRAGVDLQEMEQKFPPTDQTKPNRNQKTDQSKQKIKKIGNKSEISTVSHGGVGTELKELIKSKYNLVSSAGCSCNNRANQMNQRGIDWCERNKKTIVGWLKQGAAERAWLRPIVQLFGGTVDAKAMELIEEAIQIAKSKEPKVKPIQNHIDNLIITDRNKQRTNVFRDCVRVGNQRCVGFLVCGGPSAKQLDLTQLEQRGIWSLAVNNMAGYFRPNCFVCSDPPSKFSDGIWLDPGVMKFVPVPKLIKKRGKLRRKIRGEFQPLEINGEHLSACNCPNVWGFERRAWFQPDETFFTEESASWGNHNAGCDRTGMEKTVMTMLLGLRLLYYQGCRVIYTVGTDFHMDANGDPNAQYAFPQHRDRGACHSNNEQFRIVNDWLCKMTRDQIWEKFGVEIYNTTEQSGLEAFPHVPFDLAVQDALKHYPPTDENNRPDCSGWYEK